MGSAYTRGGEVIFVNADWLNAGPSAAWITSVLVEEVGHAIDQRVTAGGDTPGDEGEAFAAAMFRVAFSPQDTARVAAEDDSRLISVRGEVVAIEQASITIQQVYEGTPSALSEEANELASISLLPGSGFSFVSADPTAPYFERSVVPFVYA